MGDTTTTTTTDDEDQPPTSKRHLSSSSSISDHRPLPNIPFDIVAKILLNLPVKSLLRFKSTCKSWNEFISDPQFAKDHLRASASDPNPNRNRFLVTFKTLRINNESQPYLRDYPISSVLDGSEATAAPARNKFPCLESRTKFLCGSCDGMICMATNPSWPIVWNPSTGKFKELPPVSAADGGLVYGFGYDHIGDGYKVVATLDLSNIRLAANRNDYQFDNFVYTLGTDSWRQIHGFAGLVVKDSSGKFVNGTLNWLACDANNLAVVRVLSLDLATEQYQTLIITPVEGRPDIEVRWLRSAVLKGCLCIVAERDMVADYFVMKEYGNAGSWNLMFRIPYANVLPEFFSFHMAPIWVSEEGDEILLAYLGMLSVYSTRNGGSFKAAGIGLFRGSMLAAAYTETLMSPS
ncbi:F-box/kelch-repeat protein At3g23880-like [Arachis duranensis]|uniref:F-box/kelch-repeat protein At3g23880-like n=1 Tax=Arachis duranensis TaxID=130453 RepID=A0A6P5NGC9_ARADU|nr:F-box/kelch-repeat protein At3g23880-like [Arachis duranensis]